MPHPNEVLIDTLARTWNTHDIDRLLTLFTPDCHYEDMAMGAVNSGHDGLRHFATEVFRTMPDFHLEFPKRFATDTPRRLALDHYRDLERPLRATRCHGKAHPLHGTLLVRVPR